MQRYISIKKETDKYKTVKINGRTLTIEKGSAVDLTLDGILCGCAETFTVLELIHFCKLNDVRVSGACGSLWKRGALARSKGKVNFSESPSPEYIYTLNLKNPDGEIESFLKYKLEEAGYHQEVWAYEKIKKSKRPLSSIELREEFDMREVRFLYSCFRNVGFVDTVKYKTVDTFFFNPMKISKKQAQRIVNKNGKRVEKTKAKLIAKGVDWEKDAFGILESGIGKIKWVLDDVRRPVVKQIGKKKKFFDIVAYFSLMVNDKPIRYMYGKLTVPIEVKRTETGMAIVQNHQMDSTDAYGMYGVYPIIITTQPRESAFKALEQHRGGLITEKELGRIKKELNKKGKKS